MLSVIGIVYASVCASCSADVKKLVAYSSVAAHGVLHVWACSRSNVEGLPAACCKWSITACRPAASSCIVGMIYERDHTRMLDDLGGLAARLPCACVRLVFISMASIGLPGLNGFVGEMLALAGMFKTHWVYAALGATGVVLGSLVPADDVAAPAVRPAQAAHGVRSRPRDVACVSCWRSAPSRLRAC